MCVRASLTTLRIKSWLIYFRISALSTSLLVTNRSRISYTSCHGTP